MKTHFLFLFGLIMSTIVFAQAPHGISHQAVMRDTENNLIVESPIGLKVSIRQGTHDGIAVYVETHNVMTNQNGLISYVIGDGDLVQGVFQEIDWTDGPYWLETKADPDGGTNYTISGVSQFLSVPYALHSATAEVAETLKDGSNPGDINYWDGEKWVPISPGEHNQTLRLCDGVPTWGPCLYDLILLAEPLNGGSVTGEGKYEEGAGVSIGAIANEGWEFVEWTGDIAYVDDPDSADAIVTMPAQDVSITANFQEVEQEYAQLTITVFCLFTGMPMEDAWVDLFSMDGVFFFWGQTDENGQVIFPDVPPGMYELIVDKDGYFWHFYDLEMGNEDLEIVVHLDPKYFELSLFADPTEGGTVEGSGIYEYGEEVEISASPSEGWEFVNWTGEIAYVDDPSSAITIVTMPAQDISLTAVFGELAWQQCGFGFTFMYRGEEVTYGTRLRNGLCWLDRNLGALRVPIEKDDSLGYGDLFQWGRLDDHHQDRYSNTTSTISTINDPGHGDFITVDDTPWDWLNPQEDELWQDYGGINNPCPPGWRVPTEDELDIERASWSSNNTAGAYGSTLKWPVGGCRYNDGTLLVVGFDGCFWSSSVSEHQARWLNVTDNHASILSGRRAFGMEVRCVMEEIIID